MTNRNRSFNESSLFTETSTFPRVVRSVVPLVSAATDGVEGTSARIFSFETAFIHPPQRRGFRDFSERISELERDATRAAGLAEARRQLAQELGSECTGIAALRLRRGLSQSGLAELMDTSQPKVSRMEAGLDDVRHSTLKKLAEALGATIDEVSNALDESRGQDD